MSGKERGQERSPHRVWVVSGGEGGGGEQNIGQQLRLGHMRVDVHGAPCEEARGARKVGKNVRHKKGKGHHTPGQNPRQLVAGSQQQDTC